MKKIVLIIGGVAFAGVLVFAGYSIWKRSSGGDSSFTSPLEPSGEESSDEYSGGIKPSTLPDAPRGSTFVIGTEGRSVTVKNFYQDALRVVEGREIILKETPVYSIRYNRRSTQFFLVVMSEPIATNVNRAERDLLATLGIVEKQACRLDVGVIVPWGALGGAQKDLLPLSFCKK